MQAKSSDTHPSIRRLIIPTITAVIIAAAAPSFRAEAQAEESGEAQTTPSEPSAPAAIQPKASKAKRVRSRKAEPQAAAKRADTKDAPVAAPATLAAAAATGAERAGLGISAKLTQAGAGTCSATIDADAVSSMIGVTQSNIVTTWSNVEPRDKHAVNVFVGQRYGGNQAVPFGVTGLIASPNASGTCDSTVVQVVTSPLPCANVRETLLRGGKMEGDLAGIPLIQTGQDQTLLMSTATNSCVLIGFHTTYRK